MNIDASGLKTIEKAKEYADGTESLLFVDFVDINNHSTTRVFQFSRFDDREAYVKLTSWAIKAKRMLRVVPFSEYK